MLMNYKKKMIELVDQDKFRKIFCEYQLFLQEFYEDRDQEANDYFRLMTPERALEIWADNKVELFLELGESLKYEREVSYHTILTPEDVLDIFSSQERQKIFLGLESIDVSVPYWFYSCEKDDEPHWNAVYQCPFLRNGELIRYGALGELFDLNISKSSTLSKVLTILFKGDMQMERAISRYTCAVSNNTTKGKRVISIDPIDLLSMGVSSSWASCTSINKVSPDEGAESPLTILWNQSSMIEYIYQKENTFYIGEGEVEVVLEDKRWRRVIYLFNRYDDSLEILAGKQYPFQIKDEDINVVNLNPKNSFELFEQEVSEVVRTILGEKFGIDHTFDFLKSYYVTRNFSQIYNEKKLYLPVEVNSNERISHKRRY